VYHKVIGSEGTVAWIVSCAEQFGSCMVRQAACSTSLRLMLLLASPYVLTSLENGQHKDWGEAHAWGSRAHNMVNSCKFYFNTMIGSISSWVGQGAAQLHTKQPPQVGIIAMCSMLLVCSPVFGANYLVDLDHMCGRSSAAWVGMNNVRLL